MEEDKQPPVERTPKVPSKRRPAVKTLDFVKEWGGMATLLVALLYTFPFEAFDRYSIWARRDVEAARAVLSDATDTYIEGTKTISSMNFEGPDGFFSRDFIYNLYNSKVHNILVPNIHHLKAAAPELGTVEVYGIGSLLSLTGQTREGIAFYDLALERERDPAMLSSILREKANALSRFGPAQDYRASQESYLLALANLADGADETAHFPYMRILSELVIIEYLGKMFDCANSHRAYFYQLRDWAAQNPNMQPGIMQLAPMFEAAVQRFQFMPSDAGRCGNNPVRLAAAAI